MASFMQMLLEDRIDFVANKLGGGVKSAAGRDASAPNGDGSELVRAISEYDREYIVGLIRQNRGKSSRHGLL